MKYVIIGGVAGGATAAARLRRIDESGEIVLFEKGSHISYANCGLPYYIGGTIEERDRLFVQTPEAFARRFNADIRTNSEVVGIDTAAKRVRVRPASGAEYEESYDKLLLSSGALPVRPPLPGIDGEGVFTLRNVEDTDRIKKYIDTHSIGRAVVVGGGFIGLEMAENLHDIGAHVSIVEKAGQVMPPVDFSIASAVHRHLMDKGVHLHIGKGVEGFEREGSGTTVLLDSGERLTADIVLLSIGVAPNTALAKAAGIELGARGIRVNEFMETSAPDVYAVGDAVEFDHPITGEPWLNFLAGPANRQARIAADNMATAGRTAYEGSIGTAIAKVFALTVATTGLPAKRLRQLGMDFRSITTVSGSHAGYYPGASSITTKLTFHPTTGKLYGAQCVGMDGVDKRLDQIALVIKKGGTVSDLARLEHAYAPPYSSAKDPIAIAGYAAGNVVSGAMPVLYWRDIAGLDLARTVLLDVRTTDEHGLCSIPHSVNIPLDDLRSRIDELPKDKDIVVYCAVGLRGYLATRILLGRGFTSVRNLSGGFATYRLATQDIVNEPFEDTEGASGEKTSAPKVSAVEKPVVNACGLQCPGPIMKLKEAIEGVSVGETIEIIATDDGFPRDAEAWCKSTGHRFVSRETIAGTHAVVIEKRDKAAAPSAASVGESNKTLIMFSDDLDRAIATFVLANGAAATGGKVSVFFTFWGLNLLKKENKPKVKKDFFGRMFSMMMPSSSRKLSLSQMSMLGMGDRLIRFLMRRKGIASLEELRDQALQNGVEFIACQMTMDLMGISREELIDGVEVGGVATYMQRAEESRVNLFL